jgi:hypothetical protein
MIAGRRVALRLLIRLNYELVVWSSQCEKAAQEKGYQEIDTSTAV